MSHTAQGLILLAALLFACACWGMVGSDEFGGELIEMVLPGAD